MWLLPINFLSETQFPYPEMGMSNKNAHCRGLRAQWLQCANDGMCFPIYHCKILTSHAHVWEARRSGDSSPSLKPFEFSLNWKPHLNAAHTAIMFLLFIKNKRRKSRRYCHKFHTHMPDTYAFSVIETRHQRSGPACVCGNRCMSHRGTAFRDLKTEVQKTWVFLAMAVFQ